MEDITPVRYVLDDIPGFSQFEGSNIRNNLN